MKVLRIAEVVEKTGLKRSTIYKLERSGKFPKRKVLTEGSKGARGWVDEEIEEWIANLPEIDLNELEGEYGD